MNLKVPGAILTLGCAILSTRAKTVRGVVATPLRRTRVNLIEKITVFVLFIQTNSRIFCISFHRQGSIM